MRNIFSKTFVVGLVLVVSGRAATNIINFNTDPKPLGVYSLHGNVLDVNGEDASWRPSGGASGAANDGYLAVTDALGGSQSVLVFKDLEAGLIVKAFTFECDLRIGGGRGGTTEPADGFSVNFASADDPLVVASDADESPVGLFAGTINEPAPSALAEEGTQTGLAVGFDSWGSGPLSSTICDVVGMSIRVDGQVIAQLPVPISAGNVYYPTAPRPGSQGTAYTYDVPDNDCSGGGDAISLTTNVGTNSPLYLNSLQTGALNSTDDLDGDGVPGEQSDWDTAQPVYGDPNYGLWIKNLAWAKFKMEVTEEGAVKITWKGVEITPPGGIPTTFSPIPGRIVFGGRTGGSWLVHHVDNITLVTIPADKIVISKVNGTPTGFALTIIDSGQSVLDPTKLQLKVNGASVTASSVSKNTATGTSTIYYSGPALTAGSTNALDIVAMDTIGNTVTGTKSFIVPGYYLLPAAYAVAVDTTKPGFKLRVQQVDLGQTLPTTVARAERQLHGDIGANVAGGSPGADGYIVEPLVINYEQGDAGGTPLSAGRFTNDVLIPGIPGGGQIAERNLDNIAMEILTYVQFPAAGAYKITFNSDDGFRTLVGNQTVDVLGSAIFSEADFGKGASDISQWIYVAQPGAYPFRTVWFEGGGGASLEWYSESDLGVKALLNDSSVTGALKAYREATGTRPAAVTYAYPDRSSGNPYFPNDPITVEWTDGTTQVSTGSILLWVNDAPVTVTPTKVGAVTKLQYAPPSPGWPSGSNNKVTLVWSDNASPAVTRTNTWNFNVAGWVTLPPSAAIAASAVDTTKTGFKIKTHKADVLNDLENTSARAIEQLAGGRGPNVLDTTAVGADGYYIQTGVINYEVGALTGNPPWDPSLADSVAAQQVGNFTTLLPPDAPVDDALFPGEPIKVSLVHSNNNQWQNSMAMEVLTVLNLQAGWYWTGVNSDDGFKLSFAANPLDVAATVPDIFEGGKGSSDVNGLFYVSQAGYYPVRLIWYQGGGGANCEWYMENTSNYQRTLVNETAVAGHVNAYQYPVTAPPAGYVKSITPNNPPSGVRQGVGSGKKVQAVIVDGSTPVDQNSIVLKLNGTAVSPITKNKVGTETTVTYSQPLPANTLVTVEVSWTDAAPRSSSWSFTTGVLPGTTFVIEAEDFNTGGGQTVAGASTMPYLGNAYTNLGASFGVDYKDSDGNDSRPYRPTLSPNANMDAGPGDFDRGGWDMNVNYKIGWIDSGDWFNYTRTFPAGSYNVYLAVSHADAPTSATRIGGSLQMVTGDVTVTNQTLTQLGTFDGPATGGWGFNRLIPLADAGGNPVSVSLSGTQTIRYTASNGDYDFMAFVPGGTPLPRFNPPALAGGTVTIAWTGAGVLQEASNLTGSQSDWTDVANPTNPFPVTPAASARKFYRLRP